MSIPASIATAVADSVSVGVCKLHSFGCSLVRAAMDVMMMMPSGNQKLLGWLGNHLVSIVGQRIGGPPDLLPVGQLALGHGLAALSITLVLLLRPLSFPAALAVAILMGAFVVTAQMPPSLLWSSGGLECPMIGGLLAASVALSGATPRFCAQR